VRIKATSISSEKINLTSTIKTSRFTLSRNLTTGLLLCFCDNLNLHISVGLFKLRVPAKVTSKRISQANYLYRTSISCASTHPQYWNLIHIKYPIMNFFYSIMKFSFPVSIFNAHMYFFAISEKLLHENMYKTLATTHNLFTNWGKSRPSGQKTVLFLMRSCSIQSLVLHSDNNHMQNRHHVFCGLVHRG